MNPEETLKSKSMKITSWLTWSVLFFFLASLVLGVLLLAFISLKLPSVASLQKFRPPIVSEVYSDEYVKIGEFYQERRIYVPLNQVPPLLVKAIVASEDAQFFEHKGISLTGILRAFLKNLIAGQVKQGGSTITQQVAKGLLLNPERSLTRKLKEAVLAFKMEKYLSKEQILEVYLNQIYLGHSAYGIAAAAQVYFGKNLSDLTLGEVAMLAGLTRAPSRDNPYTNFKRAIEQQQYVLSRMLEEKYITETDYKTALTEKIVPSTQPNLNLKYAPYFVEHVRRYVTEKYGVEKVLTEGLQIFTMSNVQAALVAQKALREGLEELDRHQGYRGPIETVPKMQRAAYIEKLKEALGEVPLDSSLMYTALVTEVKDDSGLTSVSLGSQSGVIPIEEMKWARKPNSLELWTNNLIEKPSQALKVGDVIWVRPLATVPSDPLIKKIALGTKLFTLTQEPVVQGAIVAIEPVSGAIHSMVGGYDFEKSEFNRAVQAKRQPGSAFKPFIYAAALDFGYTPASMLVDAPIVYDDPTTEFHWRPKNVGGKFYGDSIFRDCLIESRNVPTIKIVQDLGIDTIINYALKIGITSPLSRNFSLALGSSGVTPLELISAYAVFASGGKKFREPISIKKIVDRDGKVLERNLFHDPSLDLIEQTLLVEQEISSEELEKQATEIGKDVKAELPSGYALSPQTAFIMTHLLKQVISSGTGRRAAAINRPAAGKTGTTNENHDAWFVGYTPALVAAVWLGFDEASPLGVSEEGGRAATPIWLAFMQEALAKTPSTDFQVPEGVIFVQIDPKSGKLATAKTKNPVFEVFREGTQPKETSEEAEKKKSSQQFFLQE